MSLSLCIVGRVPAHCACAFALLREEGIGKGGRRVVAVTADDAAAAIAAGEALAADVEAAAAIREDELDNARCVKRPVSLRNRRAA